MSTATLTIAEQAEQLRALKREAAEADSIAKDLKAQYKEAEIELHERMSQEGIQSIKHDGTLYVPAGTTYGQVQDRAEFVAWAEAERPELLETKERKALVNEIVRECLDNGTELPPGLGFYVQEYVSLRTS